MPNRPAVLVVHANGEVFHFAHGDVDVVLVNFDDIRDYETPRAAVEALLRQVERLPEGEGGFRVGRSEAIAGLTLCEPMTREPAAAG